MLKRGLFACAVLGMATSAFAGARIDLRPVGLTVDNNTVTVAPNTNMNVQVFLVDTGNPQGNINLRGAFLDFADTTGVTPAATFNWVNPFMLGTVFPNLPYTAWVYPLSVENPAFQIVIPDNGEVMLGSIMVNSGPSAMGVINVMNSDEPDANRGARVDFGFGLTPADPVTTWRAFNGELTGGVLNVVPEPTTLVLLGAGALAALRRRRTA